MIEEHGAVEQVVIVFFSLHRSMVVHLTASIFNVFCRVPEAMVVPKMKPVAIWDGTRVP